MAVQNLGRVGIVLKGAWNSATSYVPLDLVSYDGNSWVAKRNNTNVTPNSTNSDDWQLISNNADLVATVQGYKNDAEAAATSAASDAVKGTEAQAMIAPAEASTTASMAHPAGSFFILSGTLYQTTVDISSGGTITPGTNCQAVPNGLGGEVSDLKSANPIININYLLKNDTNYTIETAINAVWDNLRSFVKKGAVLTFRVAVGVWESWQFVVSDNIPTEAQWKNLLYWKRQNDFVNDLTRENPIININYSLKNSTDYTIETAINAVWDNFRSFVKKGAIIVYKTAARVWESMQFVVADNTPTETQWKNLLYWKPVVHNSRESIVLAAYDSTDEAKVGADMWTGTETNGINLINQAIALLPNGGRIYLRNGTYKGSGGVNISANNIIIEGESLAVKIQRDSGNDIYDNIGKTGTILKNISATQINFTSSARYILDNCLINSNLMNVNNYPGESVYVPPVKGIDGINNAIINMGADGGTIFLGEGEYTGSAYLGFYKSSSPTAYKSNIRIVGRGFNTIISRTSGADCVANSASISNNIIENVRFAHYTQRTIGNPAKMLRFIKCWEGETYLSDESENAVNVVNIGAGRYFDKYSKAYDKFTATTYPISPTERWEFHIYGHIVETSPVILKKSYIDIIGHNAIVELRGNGGVRFVFTDPEGGYYGTKLGVIKNVHFLKTGCYNYYQNYCVFVNSATAKFYDCIFENASSSPTPFDQRDYQVSQEATAGARRHGIGIECMKYGRDCELEFHDCIGIGSPYGFMNTRGWYLVYGSPKLFNCVGYGGGIGEFCHGIVNHRGSQAELFSCVGYASKTAYRTSAGIRFQAAGSSMLIGCIGYGSGGTQYVSEGVSAERITEICTALEIDPSLYVVDGVVQYASLPDAVCAEIRNEDITLTPLNKNTEEGYGISFWSNNGCAKLVDCQGYSGSGENSHGLHILANASPTIIGGIYGAKDMLQNIALSSNSGNDMITGIGGELNDYAQYEVAKITISITGGTVQNHDLLYIETTESTPQVIVNGFDLYGYSSIAILQNLVQTVVPGGEKLKIYIMRNGSKIAMTGSYIMHVQYSYAADDSSALYIQNNPNAIVMKAIIKAAGNNKAIVTVGENAVKVYDCAMKGSVDAGVVFSEKTGINGSSNYVLS